MADSNLVDAILQAINKRGHVNTLQLATELNVEHQSLVGAMMSIDAFGDVIKCEARKDKRWTLSKEGEWISVNGSQEYQLFQVLGESGVEQKKLVQLVSEPQVAKIGLAKAMEYGWISIDKGSEIVLVKRKVSSVEDQIGNIAKQLSKLSIKFNEVSKFSQRYKINTNIFVRFLLTCKRQ